MDISMFLAQAFGLYLTIGGVALLLHKEAIDGIIDLFSRNRAAIIVGGFVALLIGIPLILIHSVWDGSWRVVVSVLVWLTFIKGVVRVLAPGTVMSMAESLRSNAGLMRGLILFMIAVGLYLLYVGFGVSM